MPEGYEALDRRPIAARGLGLSKRAASALARAGVSPNAISVAGMLAGIGAGIALALTARAAGLPQRALFLLGALLVLARLVANMLDGMVAVESGRASPVGELYNEVPDRVSDAATLVGAGYAAGSGPLLGWTAALVALFVAYVRTAGKAAGAPHDWRGPMAKQQRMATVIAASVVSAALGATAAARYRVTAAALVLIVAGGAITAVRRLLGIATKLRAR